MNDSDDTFRVQVRFNKIEYANLEEDLSRYEGAARAGRIRLLMRVGLAVSKGQSPGSHHSEPAVHLAPVVGMPRPVRKETSPVAIPATEAIENLEMIGFDLANFQFGQAS